MSPTSPHVIVAVPLPADEPPLEPTTPPTTALSEITAYGPAPRSTCEAAISNLDRENCVYYVVELSELPDPKQSELSKGLDKQAEERTQAAADLGGFT